MANETVLNAGDNVGYGASPEACVDFLRARPNIVTVQGNYDKNVGRFPDKEDEYRKKWADARPEKFKAIRRDSNAISDSTRAWLLDLPQELRVACGDTRVLLTHYAPGSKEGLGRWTSDDHLKELAGSTDAEIVVCGHTHSPFVRQVGDTLFINPGTVGRGLFNAHSAAFAVLHIEPGCVPTADLRRTRYDTTRSH